MDETTRVTDKGRTTISGEFRERYEIEPGGEIKMD